MSENRAEGRTGPIFLLADDDRAAANRLTECLYPECYYVVSVSNPRHLLSYAKRLQPQSVFLADPIEFPRGGTLALLRRLVGEVDVPVIVLTENWSADAVSVWKKLGAADCLPHPTRFNVRLRLLREKMQTLAIPLLKNPSIPMGDS